MTPNRRGHLQNGDADLLTDGQVSCIDLDEEAELPDHLAVGSRTWHDRVAAGQREAGLNT